MIKAIGGFGGVKVSGTVDGSVLTVEFSRREAYCEQGVPIEEMENIALRSGDMVQRLRGYRIEWKAHFEAKTANKTKLSNLEKILRCSQVNGTDITLTPQWNTSVPDSQSFSVKVKDDRWGAEAMSERVKIGNILDGIIFQSSEWATEIDYFTEGRYIHIISTIDGKAISFEGLALEITETRRS